MHSRKCKPSLPSMKETFQTWFRGIREKKQLTQTEAADQLGLSSPTISRWEDGTEPRVRHLPRLIEWAPIKADKLLEMFK